MPPTLPDLTTKSLLRLAAAPDRRAAARRVVRACATAEARDRLLVALKDESERYLNIEPRTALALAETLVDVARLANAPRHVGFGRLAEADAQRFLGDCPRAYVRYDEAGAAFLDAGDAVGWARSRIGWILAAHVLGRGEDALAVVARATEILTSHGEWIRAGALALNAGIVWYELGHFGRATEQYRAAIRFYERGAADPATRVTAEVRIARARLNLAEILTRQGEFRAATALYDEARASFVRHGVKVSVILADRYVANLLADQGRYTAALARYQDALDALETGGLDLDAAQVMLSAAECYLGLNRPTSALGLADAALGRLLDRSATSEAARARYHRALALAQLGQAERALAELDEAATAFARIGLTADLAVARLQRARLYLDQERWAEARQEAERASDRFAERGMVVRAAQAGLVRAEAAWRLDLIDDATSDARAALEVARRHGVPSFDHAALLLLGRAARRAGDMGGALAATDAAMDAIDRLQGFLSTELRTDFLADKLPVYEEAIDLRLSLGQAQRAFAALERAKSRVLVDYLLGHPDVHARAPGASTQALLDALETAREEHHALYRRLHGDGLSRPPIGNESRDQPEAAPGDDTVLLRTAIAERERQIGILVERLSLERPDGFERPIPPPDDLLAPPVLDARSALIEYYLRADGGVAFVVTAGGIETVPLAARPDEVARLLNRWQLNLDAAAAAIAAGIGLGPLAGNARALLAALYRLLLQPLEPAIAGKGALTIVPYGPLHGVPFHALFDGRRFVLETHEVAVSPSSSLFRLTSARARRVAASALVVGHGDDGRLPGAVAEARTIAQLLPGECVLEAEARREAIRAGAPRHAILHVACHGEARLDNPRFAHLKLADGLLGASDVFGLGFDGALVTLSACETGRSVARPGDELLGLSRGFLFAGASTLVQSLWRVDDEGTVGLMEDFYRGLLAGRSKGAALRAAQLAALDRLSEHPCRWAAFQLIGDRGKLAITGRDDAR